MIDWNGAVLDYCQKAYGKKRGEMITQKLRSIEHDKCTKKSNYLVKPDCSKGE